MMAGSFCSDVQAPRRGTWPVVLLLVTALACAGPANAQSTSGAEGAGRLPTVVYPTRDPDTAPPDRVSRGEAPLPAVIQPEPDYMWADGIWGYWGGDGLFHRRPGFVGRDEGFRGRSVFNDFRGNRDGFRLAEPHRDGIRRVSLPRFAQVLPVRRSGGIVVEHPSMRGRR
jgi:hypothetical protein